MKNKEKKIKATEKAKKEVKTEENGVQLTDEELSQVTGAGDESTERVVRSNPDPTRVSNSLNPAHNVAGQ